MRFGGSNKSQLSFRWFSERLIRLWADMQSMRDELDTGGRLQRQGALQRQLFDPEGSIEIGICFRSVRGGAISLGTFQWSGDMSLLFALVCILQADQVDSVVECDLIEVNHVHDEKFGMLVFDQLIFWKKNAGGEHRSIGYVILKNCRVKDESHKKTFLKKVELRRKAVPMELQHRFAMKTKYPGQYVPSNAYHPKRESWSRRYVVNIEKFGKRYRITASEMRESNTIGDPEIRNRWKGARWPLIAP